MPETAAAVVRSEVRDAVGIVTLDDPKHRNALSRDVVSGILDSLDRLEADPAVRVLVITATPPVFSAGGHIGDLTGPEPDLQFIYSSFLRIAESPLPAIAAVTGHAVGAGINLLLACDIAVASLDARLDNRFLEIGLHPGGGFCAQLQRAVGSRRAAALTLLADTIDARQGVEFGLLWDAVSADEVLPRALELADRIARRPRELLERTKRTLQASQWVTGRDAAVALEYEAQRWSMGQPAFRATIEAALGARAKKG